jgi:ribosomal 50S subunit-associated protein YjgA (DUF615 family)
MRPISQTDAERLKEIGREIQKIGAAQKPPKVYHIFQADLEKIAEKIEELLSDAS